MRRTSQPSSRTSFPMHRRIFRPGLRPVVSLLEDRTLLSTITWASDASGNWDDRSMWTGDIVPGVSDIAVIDFAGITVTHESAGSDSVGSLTSEAQLNISGGSLDIVNGSSISGSVTMSGGTLETTGNMSDSGNLAMSGGTLNVNGGATLTVSGPINWTGGAIMTGTAGTVEAEGGLTLGISTSSVPETLDGVTLDNAGAATLSASSSAYGLLLENGAVFDNQCTGSLTFETSATVYSDNAATFLNEGILTQTESPAPILDSVETPTFDQTSTGSTSIHGSGSFFDLGFGGSISGTIRGDAGTTLSFNDSGFVGSG